MKEVERLTQSDGYGNWNVKGLKWKDTYEGNVITKNTEEKMYAAFCKLLEYEETNFSPSEIEELMEKNIAEKPEMFGDGYSDGELVYDEWKCPNCGENYEMEFDQYDYCPNCGQRIDWSEKK